MSGWTARTAAALGLAALFEAVQTDIFGLAPGASSSIVAQGSVLGLCAAFAIRVSARTMAVALFLGVLAIYADQATIALGVPRQGTGVPADFWITTSLRAAATWSLFPLLARLAARLLPTLAQGPAVGAAVPTLAFVRSGVSAGTVAAVLDPGAQHGFVLLLVPLIPTAIVVALITTIFVALRGQGLLRLAVVCAALVTIGTPAGSTVLRDQRLASGIELEPSDPVGPLTPLQAEAVFADQTSAATVLWDGARIRTLVPYQFVRSRDGHVTARLVPALNEAGPGPHQLSIQVGTEVRTRQILVPPPGGLQIDVSEQGEVILHGPASDHGTLLVVGAFGPELVSIEFTNRGEWFSPRVLGPGNYTLTAQSDHAWAMASLTQP